MLYIVFESFGKSDFSSAGVHRCESEQEARELALKLAEENDMPCSYMGGTEIVTVEPQPFTLSHPVDMDIHNGVTRGVDH